MTEKDRLEERAIQGLRDYRDAWRYADEDKFVEVYPKPMVFALTALFRAKSDAEQEAKRWKAIAVDLAECHAANAECPPKSLSKYNRGRYKSILETTVKLLTGGWPSHGNLMRDPADTIKRCEQAIEGLGV